MSVPHRAAGRDRHRSWRALIVLAAIALLATCATNPVTGESELSLVGEKDEIAMGRQNAASTAQAIGLIPDSSVQRYVSTLGKTLAAHTERPSLPWSYQAVDDPAVNAFALPGGFVFVTRGLLTHINNEAELATVLGHESGHVAAKHSVHQMSEAEVAQLGLGVGMAVSKQVAQYGRAFRVRVGPARQAVRSHLLPAPLLGGAEREPFGAPLRVGQDGVFDEDGHSSARAFVSATKS